MAVGVPENDVFAAADAVLARGERPTVERVRLELGRGSPARVGALLDQWWEQLASRLRGEARLPGLPAEVAQAFVAIWQQATVLAQGVVEQSLAAQRQVLEGERERLAAVEDDARQETARYRHQAAEAIAACRTADTRLADMEQLLEQRRTQIEDQHRQRGELIEERDHARQEAAGLRQQLQNVQAQAEQARLEQERYTRDVESRAFKEIDRAREESKNLTAQLKDANGRAASAQRAAHSSDAALAAAQEQAAEARGSVHKLLPELEQERRAGAEAAGQVKALQALLQSAQAELGGARESAAAAQARADALSQQVAQLTAAAVASRPRRSRKPAADS